MEHIDFGSILLVAAAVSLVQQWLKSKAWSSLGKKAFAIILSLIAAGCYIYFKDTAFWATFITILVSASAIYALFVKDLFPKE
jgi:uncharacterized membrane protein YbaN (DUF454 family)